MHHSARPLIWLVDDNANVRASVHLVLEFEGLRVAAYESGIRALEELRACEPASLPDLLLLDHQMPGLDGYQVLERIRREATLRHIKVVMLTGCAEVMSFPEADEALYKPVDVDQLLASIRRHLAVATAGADARAQASAPAFA